MVYTETFALFSSLPVVSVSSFFARTLPPLSSPPFCWPSLVLRVATLSLCATTFPRTFPTMTSEKRKRINPTCAVRHRLARRCIVCPECGGHYCCPSFDELWAPVTRSTTAAMTTTVSTIAVTTTAGTTTAVSTITSSTSYSAVPSGILAPAYPVYPHPGISVLWFFFGLILLIAVGIAFCVWAEMS